MALFDFVAAGSGADEWGEPLPLKSNAEARCVTDDACRLSCETGAANGFVVSVLTNGLTLLARGSKYDAPGGDAMGGAMLVLGDKGSNENGDEAANAAFISLTD